MRVRVKPPPSPLRLCFVSRCTDPIALTLSEEQAVTLEAAMMKSRISIVAPGRPMLKNRGLQCFMIVFTMSCKHKQARVSATSCLLDGPARGCQTLACGLYLGRSDIVFVIARIGPSILYCTCNH